MNTEHVEGLAALWARTTGSSEIRVAVLDGSVDLGHPCLEDAALVAPEPGLMELHGTHVTSLLLEGTRVW